MHVTATSARRARKTHTVAGTTPRGKYPTTKRARLVNYCPYLAYEYRGCQLEGGSTVLEPWRRVRYDLQALRFLSCCDPLLGMIGKVLYRRPSRRHN